MSQRRTDSRVIGMLAFAIIALLVVMMGCERKITGNVDVDETVSDQCFSCHDGQLDSEQGEWVNSQHASGESVDYTNRTGRDCAECHSQDGFIDFWTTGTVNPPYPTGEDYAGAKGIGCFACHNPHETATLALRSQTVGAYTLAGGDAFNMGSANLCVRCHHSTGVAPTIAAGDSLRVTNKRLGPHHGPQGDMLNGSTGYEDLTGYSYATTSHALAVDDGCIGCHMKLPPDVNIHGGYEIGGHTFNMEDEAGNDLTGTCMVAACHGSGGLEFEDATSGRPYDFTLASGASQDWDGDGTVSGYQTEFDGMIDTLFAQLRRVGVATADSYLVASSQGVYYYDEEVLGAFYNFKMATEDRSHGIHNFGYIQSLLDASIDYVRTLPDASALVASR